MFKYLKLSIFALVLVCFLTTSSQAQVSLTPYLLYIHDNTNIENLYVTNSSDNVQEVNISVGFMYPDSDEEGKLTMVEADSEIVSRYSLDENIRFFPRRFVLQPGQQQSVRVQVLPAGGKDDGLYWSRIFISSTVQRPEVGELADGMIGAGVSFILNQDIPVFYHRGSTSTGIELTDFRTENSNGQLVLLPKLKRHGNSPYIGSVFSRLMDADGNVVIESRSNALAYFEERRRFTLDVTDIPSGTYTLELEFRTERRDVSRRDLVQADPVVERFTVEL